MWLERGLIFIHFHWISLNFTNFEIFVPTQSDLSDNGTYRWSGIRPVVAFESQPQARGNVWLQVSERGFHVCEATPLVLDVQNIKWGVERQDWMGWRALTPLPEATGSELGPNLPKHHWSWSYPKHMYIKLTWDKITRLAEWGDEMPGILHDTLKEGWWHQSVLPKSG